MGELENLPSRNWIGRLGAVARGLPQLLAYRRTDLPHDFIAGLSVAATGLFAVREVISTLTERGTVFVSAGRQTEWREWSKLRPRLGTLAIRRFPPLRAAL
jgi:hypothetical protein